MFPVKSNQLRTNYKYRLTFKGDIILDNCAGSGSTLVACKSLDRKFIGIEKEKKYYDICTKRLQNVQSEMLF